MPVRPPQCRRLPQRLQRRRPGRGDATSARGRGRRCVLDARSQSRRRLDLVRGAPRQRDSLLLLRKPVGKLRRSRDSRLEHSTTLGCERPVRERCEFGDLLTAHLVCLATSHRHDAPKVTRSSGGVRVTHALNDPATTGLIPADPPGAAPVGGLQVPGIDAAAAGVSRHTRGSTTRKKRNEDPQSNHELALLRATGLAALAVAAVAAGVLAGAGNAAPPPRSRRRRSRTGSSPSRARKRLTESPLGSRQASPGSSRSTSATTARPSSASPAARSHRSWSRPATAATRCASTRGTASSPTPSRRRSTAEMETTGWLERRSRDADRRQRGRHPVRW